MFLGLQQLFLGRRQQRPANDEAEQPATKKIKTGHNNDDTNTDDKAAAARQAVFSISSLLENIVGFLDNHEELQLVACNVQLYVFFHIRAAERFSSICREADPDQKSAFLLRTTTLAKSFLSAQDQLRLKTVEKPNYWQSLWMWWRRERPPRWISPFRYLLQCVYMVPVDLQAGFNFGPSCSYGDRLYFLAAAGIVVTMDAEPKPVEMEYTRKAEASFLSPGYDYIFDKLWYCATNKNSNNGKGFLVLKHQPNFRVGPSILVLDLSQTNQDIGRGDSKMGIDQRRIMPSGTFHDANGHIRGEVVVSHDLIFFCRLRI